MKRFRNQMTRARARVAFPVLGLGMGIATLVTGLERSSYLGRAVGVEQVADGLECQRDSTQSKRLALSSL